MRVLIGAGGTGGHVLPALLAARALRQRDVEVIFSGGRGVETEMVPAAGFELISLNVRGALRPLYHPANAARGVSFGAAVVRVARMIRSRRIGAVLSTGGYAAVPAALGAVVARRPLIVWNPDAKPGLANRTAARFASAVAVPFAAFAASFGDKATVVGPILRDELWHLPRRADAEAALGVPAGRTVVGLMAGSQGSARLNAGLAGCYDAWRDRPDLAVIQVTGPKQFDTVKTALDELRRPDDAVAWIVLPYLDDMASFWSAADIVLCRGGASTIAEVLVTATPAVIVPGDYAGGHQAENAAVAVDSGAAIAIADADATTERIRSELEHLVGDAAKRERMCAGARAQGGAAGVGAAVLAELVLTHGRAR